MDEYSSVSSHLLQFSPDALLVVDTNGRIVYANPTAHQLFGYSGEQLIGQPLDLLVPDRYRLRHGLISAVFSPSRAIERWAPDSSICSPGARTARNFPPAFASRRFRRMGKCWWARRSGT